MKKIFYWAPYNSKIGTINSVINSIKSLNKYSLEKYKPILLDATFEWSKYKSIYDVLFLRKEKKDFRLTKNKGYFFRRIFFIKIFIFCFFPLKKIIQKEKPDFFIAHLITSLPIILIVLFNLKTKLILRISGEPKLNIFRKYLWKMSNHKIYLVTCPSSKTKDYLLKSGLFDEKKIRILFDPVLNVGLTAIKKREKIDKSLKQSEYFLSVGRLTKQKNFLFLINCFKTFLKKSPNYKLVILGDGEMFEELNNEIKKNKLKDKILLKGFEDNVYRYMSNAKCFILPSIYENPGHVLIESAFCNCPIISSNCPTGPEEILDFEKAGYLFKVNDNYEFLKKLNEFIFDDKQKIKSKIINAKIITKKYTIFKHYLELDNLLT